MKKAKRSVTTTVCVIVALCVCYLIFCGIIGKKKFFPNTSINGIDVSNMTVKEAAAAVEDQFATEYNNAGIDVTLDCDRRSSGSECDRCGTTGKR